VLAGACVLSVSAGEGSVSTGGFILIGPFPIAFGSGPNGPLLSILAVVLGILMLVLLLFAVGRTSKGIVNQREEINK